MNVKGVSLGDQFISPSNKKSKRVSTVVDFIEHKSLVNGNVFEIEVVSEHLFMEKIVKSRCSLFTVLRNKIQ